MNRFFLVLVVVATILVASLQASTTKVEAGHQASHQSLSWTVHWGQPDRYGYLVTNWMATANPLLVVKEGAWFKYLQTSRVELFSIDQDGTSSGNYEARQAHFMLISGIALRRLDGSLLVGSNWNPEADGCPNGPTLEYERQGSNIRVTATNTTGKTLFATTDNSGPRTPRWKKLPPGDKITVRLKLAQYLSLFTRPEYNPQYGCTDISGR